MNRIILLFIVTIYCIGCKSELSENQKQQIFDRFDYKSKNKRIEILALKQDEETHVGKYFTYRKIKINARAKENCLANLLPMISTDGIITEDYNNTDNLQFKEFKKGEEFTITCILFSEKEFQLEKTANCFFYIATNKTFPQSKGCIDPNKYFQRSLTYIKYAYPQLYQKISENNFKLSIDDQNGLFYWGTSLAAAKNYRKYQAQEIDKRTYYENELNIRIELSCNFEIPDIICKN